VPAYEWTILFAGLSAGFGMLALNGLPALYHPLFNAPNFRDGATNDKFFLCLEALDPKFELLETRAYLASFEPVSVVEIRDQGSEIGKPPLRRNEARRTGRHASPS
jgi:hypothetical protein